MKQASAVLLALAMTASPLGAVGLAGMDSFAGLRAVSPPFRITWNLDAVTAAQLGGSKAFADDLGTVVFKRLKAHGVPMLDGSFDPLAKPFINVDAWARGTTRPEDPKDPQRAFHFELQVFAPALDFLDGLQNNGRVLVWERSAYGVVDAADIQPAFRTFLNLCDDFAADWRSARIGDSAAGSAGASGKALAKPKVDQGVSEDLDSGNEDDDGSGKALSKSSAVDQAPVFQPFKMPPKTPSFHYEGSE